MLESLTSSLLFPDLERAQLKLLEPLFEFYSCAPTTAIFEQGDVALYLYVILNGMVSIRYKPYDGAPITLTHLGQGDAFGWSAVVGSLQYTSSIVSDTEVHAIRIRGIALWELCVDQPEAGRIVLENLARVVSSRWQNAPVQIQAILDKAMANMNHSHRRK